MNALRLLLKDRRRSQRGSVLSGVLITVAFLGIISGALMTELTGSFIVSRTLVNRVNNEATVNSAVELVLNQIQNAPLSSPCPNVGPISLNGQTAISSYTICAPVVDRASLPVGPILNATPFTVDGTHVQLLDNPSRDAYLVSDVNGNVYEFNFGSSSWRWQARLGGIVTGPPMAMYDQNQRPYKITDLVPVTNPSDRGVVPNCGATSFCVALLTEQGFNTTARCFMAANSAVKVRPAAAVNVANVAYFGDTSGRLFAYNTVSTGNGNGQGSGQDENGGDCSRRDFAFTPGSQPVVAGPVVVQGNNRDNVYVVSSDSGSSRLLHYTFNGQSFSYVTSLSLPANAVGLATDAIGTQVPTKLAITFAGGQVDLVQIAGMSVIWSGSVPAAVTAAPYWCHCPGPTDLIGVGGQDGALYVLDSALNPYATYTAGGAAISTSPVADAAGDWFFGADDSRLYEVQRLQAQPTMTLATQWPLAGRVGSSPVINGCGAMICIYLGARNGSAYLFPLDARAATVTACIATAPPDCSGVNPRLWAQVEVGSMVSPRTVRVSGWSYYSP